MATVSSKKQSAPVVVDTPAEAIEQPTEVAAEVVQPTPAAEPVYMPDIAKPVVIAEPPPEPPKPKPPVAPAEGQPTPAEALLAKANSDWEIVMEAAKNNAGIEIFTNALTSYEETMRPGKVIDPSKGAHANLALMNRIISMTTLPKETFETLWSILLLFAFRNSERGKVFAPTSINRFMEMWRIPRQETTYLSLMNLIITTCNPATRNKNFAFIDFTNRQWRGLSEEARAKIHHFYAK